MRRWLPPASTLEGVVWPPVLSGERAQIAAFTHHLDASQWLPLEQLEQLQRAQLARLAAHCEQHSPHFRRRLRRAGLSATELGEPGGLTRLAPLTRRRLQRAGAELFCAEVPPGHAPLVESRTSGSTGEPVVVKRSALCRLHWLAVTLREHAWFERDFRGRLSAIRANIREYEEADSWGAPVSLLFPSGRSQGIPIRTPIAEQADLLERFQPASLIVLPSNLSALTEEFRRRGRTLPGLAHVRSLGETLSPTVREAAAAHFGARVEDNYSSQEVGNIAVECPSSGLYHVMAETLLVEVVDDAGQACSEGTVGRLLVSDLSNFATPLLRYEIGDYAEVGPPCPCGRGLPTLRRIAGRERNLVVKPDGSRHWPQVGFARFREVAPIAQYQLVQESPLMIEVRLVCERALTPAEESGLRGVILGSLGYPFALRFSYFPERIPLAANGKHEEFICRIAPPERPVS
jgi:phenylacetate-CoA ligase